MTPERLDACPHDRWKGAPDVISQALCSRCSWSATDLVAAYRDRVRELEARLESIEQSAEDLILAFDHDVSGEGLTDGLSRVWAGYEELEARAARYEDALRDLADNNYYCAGSPFCDNSGWHDMEMCPVAIARAALAPSEQETGE